MGWGLETNAETLIATEAAPASAPGRSHRALRRRIRCPVLVVHGDDDAVVPHAQGPRWRSAPAAGSSPSRAPVTFPTYATP